MTGKKKVGKDGVITVEESKTMETTTDMVEGMQLDRGYLSPNFVTDAERMECVLEEPLRQICQNAGFEGAIVAEKVRVSDKLNLGFNAETEQYGDLVESGVIDPTKVTRTALQNAASIASLMLTTEVMVAEIPEKRPAPASGGYGPEGMDY